MTTAKRLPLLTTVLASAMFCATPARGQSVDLEAQYRRGSELRTQHDDAGALAVFQDIYGRTHEPRALAQVAVAEGAMGRWVEAEVHLQSALAVTTDDWINRNRALLQGALETIGGHLGSLDVVCPVDGAEVWVGGQRIATLPMTHPTRLAPGSVSFEVRAPGFSPASRITRVLAGGLAREMVQLDAIPRAPQGGLSGNPVQRAEGGRTGAVAPPSRTPRTFGVIAAIGGGVLVVGGLGGYLVGLGQVQAYNTDFDRGICPGRGAPNQPQDCAERLSLGNSMEALAFTGFIAGGVLVATSAVLLLVARSTPDRISAANFSCGRGPGQVGIVCGARF